MKFKMIPSVGMPLNFKDLLKVFWHSLFSRNAGDSFAKYLYAITGHKKIFLTWKGRQAIFLGLTALKKLKPTKQKVLLPAMTCESVYYSVKAAGLIPVLYDVSQDRFKPDIQDIQKKMDDKVLTVIISPMYGILFDLTEILQLKGQNDFYLLFDGAQSLGATLNNETIAKSVDLACYSFGKSKNLSTINGGFVGSDNPEIIQALEGSFEKLPNPSWSDNISILFLIIIYSVVLHPVVFWCVTRFKKEFGRQNLETITPAKKMGKFQILMGLLNSEKFGKITSIRQANAKRLLEELPNAGLEIKPIEKKFSKHSVYLRFPVILKSEKQANSCINDMRQQGLWAIKNTYEPLYAINDESPNHYPLLYSFEKKIVVIPTNQMLNNEHIHKMIKILKKYNQE
ncbi:MAG: aminotransferase class I/II-fold pyridoxal phosphate-dependent enzyme [bacterium]